MGDDRPRLIGCWGGRVVLTGLAADPANWFTSAVNDPADFQADDEPKGVDDAGR